MPNGFTAIWPIFQLNVVAVFSCTVLAKRVTFELGCGEVTLARAVLLQVLALAMAYQSVTSTHLMRPPINGVEPEILSACLQYSRCGQAEDYNSSELVNQTAISESG